MALAMVHLLVADLWAQGHPEVLDCPEYYLGAVSPDAIHVRDHGDKSRKDYFHLNNWRRLHREPVEAYWRQHDAPFDIGYGVHVLTDCQWVARYRARIPQIILPDGMMNTTIYYNDTFVTDFELLRTKPRLQEILALMAKAQAPEDHPLLNREEFMEWLRMIEELYHNPCPKHDPVLYITCDYVEDFAKESLPLIDEIYAEVFGNNH